MTMKAVLNRVLRVERAIAKAASTGLVVSIRPVGEDAPITTAEVGQHRFHREADETEADFRERMLATLNDQAGPIRLAIFLPDIEPTEKEPDQCA